jgi:hypothetical protein
MALKKRGGRGFWHLRIYINGKQVWISTGTTSKSRAENIQRQIQVAYGAQDYRALDSEARNVCLKLFKNQRWQIAPDMGGEPPQSEELTLWKAVELCLKYPEVSNAANRERHEQAFVHLVQYFGKDRPVKGIWNPHIKGYQIKRKSQGAPESTINKEKGTFSRMF